MSRKWYDSDWVTIVLSAIGLLGMVVGNYYLHGGHIQW